MGGRLVWYVARSSGIVTWLLLSGSVLWGLVLSTQLWRRRARPAWVLDLHRFLGGASLVFLVVHITSIYFDTYVSFGLKQILVPFTGTWHPGAVAWGIVGLYLLLAVEVTSLVRTRVPLRLWRSVHYAAFPLLAVATVHALTAGTDRHSVIMRDGMLGVVGVLLLLSLVRVARFDRRDGMTAPARTPQRRRLVS